MNYGAMQRAWSGLLRRCGLLAPWIASAEMKTTLLALFCGASCAAAAPPALVRSEPESGSKNVSTDIRVLRFCFDQNMNQDTWTFWQSSGAEFPPQEGSNDSPWRDPRCIELRVALLKPNTSYAVQLNSPARQGFRSAPGGAPLPVTTVHFTTGGGVDRPAVSPGSTAREPGGKRPACPAGWTSFDNPILGLQAHVPSNYWVRLRGGVMLTVERQGGADTMAFILPLRPRPGVSAAGIAGQFAKFVAESEPRLRAEVVGEPSADRALSRFTSAVAGQPVEGRYCTLLAAGGTMAFVIGVMAPSGQLEAEMPTLERIARGFGFAPPRGKWIDYQSPAGGFTMTMPEGWQVESGDGRSGKDNIDWVASDPQKPLSRAFQWCPRYCSPALLQDPLHAIRGYQAGQFADHAGVIQASLSQISQGVKLLKRSVNEPLTGLFRKMNEQVAQMLAGLNAGQMDIVVYDCLAEARVDGQPVLVAFVAGIQTMMINGGIMGSLMDLSVTLRGWCAAPGQFVVDSPVLERVCASMQLTPAFIRRIVQGNEQAAAKIRETYASMNQIDDQIRQSRWDTMDAIAEMNYDVLRDTGGYVNETTGRIEQIVPGKIVKNSHGETVSREEVERGVSPENATVLRDAHADDYMKGVYGRIEF